MRAASLSASLAVKSAHKSGSETISKSGSKSVSESSSKSINISDSSSKVGVKLISERVCEVELQPRITDQCSLDRGGPLASAVDSNLRAIPPVGGVAGISTIDHRANCGVTLCKLGSYSDSTISRRRRFIRHFFSVLAHRGVLSDIDRYRRVSVQLRTCRQLILRDRSRRVAHTSGRTHHPAARPAAVPSELLAGGLGKS